MSCNWLIGGTEHLDFVEEYWRRYWPDLLFKKLVIQQNANFEFDLSCLDSLLTKGDHAFVACDQRFGNFKRLELMHFIANKGIKLINLISPRSMVANNAKIGTNVFVADGCIIGPNCRIEYNTVILQGSSIGYKTHIRSSNWIEPGVCIGNNVNIGSNSIICTGAIVADNISIGRNCELGWRKLYAFDIEAGSFYDSKFDNPILTYRSRIK